MKSKLYVLLALLSVAAVFTAPALAAPPSNPIWNAPAADGDGTLPVTDSSPALIEVGSANEADPLDDATGVELFIDGNPIDGTFVSLGQAVQNGGAGSHDWELEFDSSSYTPGAYRLRAVARNADGAGNNIEVNFMFVDLINPDVVSYSPLDGSDVTGSVDFSITTSDNVGVTSAEFSLDGGSGPWTPMLSEGAGVFSVDDIDVSALPNGLTFFYVEVADAAGNTMSGYAGLNVLNPEAAQVTVPSIEVDGVLKVGGGGLFAEAEATGYPTPTVTYSWAACDLDAGVCNSYAGQFYYPLESEVGRQVTLFVRAVSAGTAMDTEARLVGVVTAADAVVATPPADEPVVVPPVVVPPVAEKTPEVAAAEQKVVVAEQVVVVAQQKVVVAVKTLVAEREDVQDAKKAAVKKREAVEKLADLKRELRAAGKPTAAIDKKIKAAQKKAIAAQKAVAAEAAEAAAQRKKTDAAKAAASAAAKKALAAKVALENARPR